jgi:transcriptional regulator with XRE-family HTH domain
MRLKRIREAKGLSQRALAERIGSSQVYIAQIEGSAKNPPTRVPSVRMLEKLARALKVKVADLLE